MLYILGEGGSRNLQILTSSPLPVEGHFYLVWLINTQNLASISFKCIKAWFFIQANNPLYLMFGRVLMQNTDFFYFYTHSKYLSNSKSILDFHIPSGTYKMFSPLK